jgi:O-antigen/teichoic acid export membrane protein
MSVKSLASTYCPTFLRPAFDRVANSPIGYRLATGVFWAMAGEVISRGLTLAALVLVARMLGKTGYGELGVIQATVGMFGVFAGFGLGLTATKHVAEFRSHDPERAGRIIAVSGLTAMITGGLMAVGMLLFAPWLAEHTINAPHLTGLLRVSALMLFVSALNGAQTGALAGFEAFKTIARVNLCIGLISFPLLVAGAYFGGLTGVVSMMAVNLSVNWLLNHLALRKEAGRYRVPFTFKHCGREVSVLWRFSLPAVLSGALVGPVGWVCSAFLVNQPDGYAEMGVFSAASQLQLAILFIPGALAQIVLPMLSNLHASDERHRFMKVVWYNVLISGGITTGIVLPVSLLSGIIMRTYGKGFANGGPVLILSAVAAIPITLTAVIGRVIASKNKMWAGLILNALWAACLMVTAWLLIGHGARGLATAYLVSYVFHLLNTAIYTRLFVIGGGVQRP